jgi:hypothetical protein|tara:strand:- start:566 stop:931 length:366 start_codon:yes stop_codon:yes gene_type:complete
MSKNLKEIEHLAIVKAVLKNEYPKKVSKNFSDRVMAEIYSTYNSLYNNNIWTYGLRIASVFVFATITLFTLENITTNQVQYTKSTIIDNISTPSKNVSDKNECNGVNENKKALKDKNIKCK